MFLMCNRFTCTQLTLDSIKFKEKRMALYIYITNKMTFLKKQSDNSYFTFMSYFWLSMWILKYACVTGGKTWNL